MWIGGGGGGGGGVVVGVVVVVVLGGGSGVVGEEDVYSSITGLSCLFLFFQGGGSDKYYTGPPGQNTKRYRSYKEVERHLGHALPYEDESREARREEEHAVVDVVEEERKRKQQVAVLDRAHSLRLYKHGLGDSALGGLPPWMKR